MKTSDITIQELYGLLVADEKRNELIFNDARLDTLFLTLPVSWKGTIVQYAGRLHRLHPGKREVRIVDYVDGKVPMLARMFEKRRAGYRHMGYREEDVEALLK